MFFELKRVITICIFMEQLFCILFSRKKETTVLRFGQRGILRLAHRFFVGVVCKREWFGLTLYSQEQLAKTYGGVGIHLTRCNDSHQCNVG